MSRALRTGLLFLVVALLGAAPAVAQSGVLTGRITGSEGGGPLAGVTVRVLQSDGLLAAQGKTRADGSYRIAGIAPGTYRVVVASVGYGPREFPNTVVAAGSVTVDATLTQEAMRLEDAVVTSVSKVPEKQTEAPAAVFAMARTEIEERPALTVADHLKSVPGADVVQGGLVQSNVVARGFNNIFSGSLLTLIDYRYAAVPSLRVNVATFFPTTNEDIDKIEFVLGPGAALYGPNADKGVLNIITRSPFTSTGSTLSFEAGVRGGSTNRECGSDPRCESPTFSRLDGAEGLWRITGRHAMRLGSKVAFKVSGNYLKGTEWQERDPAEPANLNTLKPALNLPAGRCNATTGCRDFNLEQYGGEARVDVRPDLNTEIIGTFGLTHAKSLIEYTGIGAGQARDWAYRSAQLRFRHRRLFVQGFGNFSSSGNTFLLRDGTPLQDSSRVLSAQFQHGLDLFGGKTTVLYGADYIHTDARTGGTINGANEADDEIKEIGGYVHAVHRLSGKLDLIGAIRVDKHSRLQSAVWSPRAALVFKPKADQAFRLTFNRAFSTPTNNNLFLDIVALSSPLASGIVQNVRALGVPKDGFHFRVNGGCAGGAGNGLCMRSVWQPLLPPGTPELLPANAALLWQVAVTAVSAQAGAQLTNLMRTNAPTTQVGTQLRSLNSTTRQFVDIDPNVVQDIERLKPTISHSIEAGYKALIGGRFQVSADAWYEKKRNFTGPLIVESPTVFLDRATTIAYLTALFTQAQVPNAAATAQAIGTGMAGLSAATTLATTGVPLATVVPTNTPLTARPDIFLTYRNFGELDFWGADLAVDLVVGSHLTLAGSYSYVNKDYFSAAEVEGPTDIALNATKSKGSVTVGWRDDPNGWSTEARFRAVKGFPMNSGVYVSAPDPDHAGSLLPGDSYALVDLQGTWRPPVGARNMLISVNVQNLLNKHYATFVGLPNLGRMVLSKITYTF